ncbi:MAG: hypothetical protein IJY62_03560 [Clostridia bacterium]|nr:hypothetical protein [Clostridia bacterium]
MKRAIRIIYVMLLVVAMIAGEMFSILSTRGKSLWATVFAVVGLLLALILAPTVHELGHILFGKTQGMRVKYAKFSFIRLQETDGKLKVSFASPFLADETQMIPRTSGNMRHRALIYSAGGLVIGGIYMLLTAALAIVLALLKVEAAFLFWGGLPYAAYLFFLNLPPFDYADGKTDMLVLMGLQRCEGEEKAFVYAMEIFGSLSEGKSFSEVDEKYYYDLPVLPEDTPMYAIMHDLRYRLEIEKGNFDGAADKINRLAASEYLSPAEVEMTAAEITYMHAVGEDVERMEKSLPLCEGYLKNGTASTHRIMAAVYKARGDVEKFEEERLAAENALKNCLKGEAKFEKILLSRL